MSNFNLISVATKRDLPILKANVRMTNHLNQFTHICWTVVLNLDTSDFKKTCAELEILERELLGQVKFTFLNMDTSQVESVREPSYQHGFGMNQAANWHAGDDSTLIFLDPDFINLEQNWIRTKLSAHKASKLKVMGTSWDPSSLKEWIDFPAPHFFIVQSNVVRNFSLLPGTNLPLLYKDIGTKSKFSQWANQSYETCSELRRGCVRLRSFFGILAVYFFFHLNRFRILKIVVPDGLLHKAIRRVRVQSGIIFEHFYSTRAEKAMKVIRSNSDWKKSPIVVFKYLLLGSESQNLRLERPEIELSRMEFLGENGTVTAVHARGVGANFETHTEIQQVIKELMMPK
jgi:hypothetical protein